MTIPYTFAGATTAIPLANLDANFASPITLGNVAMTLSNTYTSIGNLTLTNVTISSTSTPITVPQGGTGLTSLTAGYIPYGNGTSAFGSSSNFTWSGTQLGVTGTLSVGTSAGGNIASFTNATSADLNINLTSGVSLISPTTGILAFGTSSTERMRIDSSGIVLMGTTDSSNTTRLKIVGGSTTDRAISSQLSVQRAASNQYEGISFVSGVATSAYILRRPSSDDLTFGFDAGGATAEKMRLDTSGNLLLGTTATLTQSNVMVQKNNSSNNAVVTYQYTVNASSSTAVTFSTSSLGFSGTLYYCVEVTASAYGNSNSGTGTYKGMVTGFSGGSSYQAVTNIVNTMTAGGSFSLTGGTNTVTLTINNTDGSNQKFGVVRFNINWA
jgi:hypothetical protein